MTDPVTAPVEQPTRRALWNYGGTEAERITLTDALGWVRRVRADLRPIEQALRELPTATDPARRAELLGWLVEFAEDVTGSAAELQSIAEATSAQERLGGF